jgi:dephospho-CoA kinase
MTDSKKKKILKVGITGGIGSGKTTVCKIFETLGIPVYYADDRAKWIMVNDPQIVSGVKKLFGNEAYFEDGSLNRKHIASKAFKDKSKLQKLNYLVHPAVGKDGIDWHNSQKEVPYTLKEAAIMFESDNYKLLDKTITVYAPKETRIERVMKRDGSTRAEIESRMNRQMPEEEKVKLADFVIYNDGEKLLVDQVLAIHTELIKG